MSNHSTHTPVENIEKLLIEAFSDRPLAIILPIHLKLAGDYATAAALAQVFYWHKTMKRAFYKTDADWCEELQYTPAQWETVKAKLKKLPFLSIVPKGIPAKTVYDVDYQKVGAEIANYTPKKSNKANKTSFKPTNDTSLGTLPETGLGTLPETGLGTLPETGLGTLPETGLGTLPETNTETTQRLLRNNNNEVVVDKDLSEKEQTQVKNDDVVIKLFSTREQPTAKKLIAELTTETQTEVLDYLAHKIETNQIKSSKTGYLKIIVDSVKAGTFTPITPKAKPMTEADRIAKDKQAQQQRQKVTTDNRAQLLKNNLERIKAEMGNKNEIFMNGLSLVTRGELEKLNLL